MADRHVGYRATTGAGVACACWADGASDSFSVADCVYLDAHGNRNTDADRDLYAYGYGNDAAYCYAVAYRYAAATPHAHACAEYGGV